MDKAANVRQAVALLRRNPIAAMGLASAVFGGVSGAFHGVAQGAAMAPLAGKTPARGAAEGALEGAGSGALMGAAVGLTAMSILSGKAARKEFGAAIRLALKKTAADKIKAPAKPSAKLTQDQRRNIKKSLRLIKPKTKSEAEVQELAGRPWTSGQFMRRGVIGASGGVAAGTLGGAVTGAPLTIGSAQKLVRNRAGAMVPRMGPTTAKMTALLSPRRLAAGAIGGAAFGLAIPYAQQLADADAAKRGQF